MIESTQEYQTAIVERSRRIYIRAIVDISDPDMVISAPTSSGMAAWSKPEQLHDKNIDAPARYATLEKNRWLLDGTFGALPDNSGDEWNVGAVLSELSSADGTFPTPQYIELPFSNVSILQAFSVHFSQDVVDGVATEFRVEVRSGSTVYFTQDVTGNRESTVSFDGFTVYDPTSIRVTVTKWSLPSRYARFVEIVPGIYEEWTEKMLASFSARMQGDFSCLSLPYGTVSLSMNNKSRRFEPRNKTGIFKSLEERQGIEVYIGVRLPSGKVEYKQLGVFYQSGDGWKTGDNSLSMRWDLVDIVGLLSARAYIAPATLPTTLDGWIASLAAQLGENFAQRYHVDPAYASLSVTARSSADVAGKSCGDVLRWVCMVTGTWPRADAETGDLTVEPMWQQGNKLTLYNLKNYPVMRANESVAALIFTLADGNNTQYVVSGNSTSSDKTVTVQNPFIHTTEQALTAAKAILSCYGGNVIETTGRGDPASEIGDVDTIWLDKSNATAARRKMQTFSISGGILQNCNSQFLQADGVFLYKSRVVLAEDGTWTAPDGVSKIQYYLIGGGSGGTDGEDGTIFDAGEDGTQGVGGLILSGTMQINNRQTFSAKIGRGGAKGQPGTATTFGSLTSANGKRFSPAYTDIASGEAYGRTGIVAPVNGTGDGGAAGKGGRAATTREVDGFVEIVSPPTSGGKGKAGADGCVIIYYDK